MVVMIKKWNGKARNPLQVILMNPKNSVDVSIKTP